MTVVSHLREDADPQVRTEDFNGVGAGARLDDECRTASLLRDNTGLRLRFWELAPAV